MKSALDFTASDRVATCQKSGCPICHPQQKAVERYLKDLFGTRFHPPDIRAALRGSKGFCKEHGWLAFELGLGNTFGAAILYHDLLLLAYNDLQKSNSVTSKKSGSLGFGGVKP